MPNWCQNRRANDPAMSRPKVWTFWLADEDRNAGWTNHCYVLQFVCEGEGDTPAEAWENALAGNDEGQRQFLEHEPSEARLVALDAKAERALYIEEDGTVLGREQRDG